MSSGNTVTLEFKEQKLPSKTIWCVVAEGYPQCTPGRCGMFVDLSPGTYNHVIGSGSGYSASTAIRKTIGPLSGSLDLTKSATLRVILEPG